MKVAFFDRDGTIIHDYPDQEWSRIYEPEFIEGAIETLATVQARGYKIIIITNQYLINEGFITQTQYEELTNKMIEVLKNAGVNVLDIFYCPHRRDEGCNCIKPNKGLIDQALKKYPHIELTKSWIIGDSVTDMILAENIGANGLWLTQQGNKSLSRVTQVKKITEILRYM